MLKYLEPLDWLPTADDLPESDETPVDSEIQETLSNLLKFILATIFAGLQKKTTAAAGSSVYPPDSV